jgi:hypothetical protein
MYLLQLFLPLYDEQGLTFPDQHFYAVRDQLTEKFGGITTYSRAQTYLKCNSGKGHVVS